MSSAGRAAIIENANAMIAAANSLISTANGGTGAYTSPEVLAFNTHRIAAYEACEGVQAATENPP